MFAEFLKKDEFYKHYMKSYATRMAKSNLEMEENLNDKTINMYYNIFPFIKLIENNDIIKPQDVINIANDVNKSNGLTKGFRKTQVNVKKAKNFFPIKAYLIPQAFYSLFDNYYNTWSNLPIYEKEARFHIDIVRMQPFEDGNKRTARIILNYNLCKQNRAPIIIPNDEMDEYFNYIDTYDIDGFSKYLKRKSYEELNVMLKLYENICGNSFVNKLQKEESFYENAKHLLADINMIDKQKQKINS